MICEIRVISDRKSNLFAHKTQEAGYSARVLPGGHESLVELKGKGQSNPKAMKVANCNLFII